MQPTSTDPQAWHAYVREAPTLGEAQMRMEAAYVAGVDFAALRPCADCDETPVAGSIYCARHRRVALLGSVRVFGVATEEGEELAPATVIRLLRRGAVVQDVLDVERDRVVGVFPDELEAAGYAPVAGGAR